MQVEIKIRYIFTSIRLAKSLNLTLLCWQDHYVWATCKHLGKWQMHLLHAPTIPLVRQADKKLTYVQRHSPREYLRSGWHFKTESRPSSLPSWYLTYATTRGFITFCSYLLIYVTRRSAWDWVRTHRGDRCHTPNEWWYQRHIFRVDGQEPIPRFWNASSISGVYINARSWTFF